MRRRTVLMARSNAKRIYRRLKHIDIWIESNFDRCFQLMETDDLRLFQRSSQYLLKTDLPSSMQYGSK